MVDAVAAEHCEILFLHTAALTDARIEPALQKMRCERLRFLRMDTASRRRSSLSCSAGSIRASVRAAVCRNLSLIHIFAPGGICVHRS